LGTLVFIAIGLFVIFQLFWRNEVPQANIIYQGEIIKSIPVETFEDFSEENYVFSVPQLPQVEFVMSNRGIAFLYSDCPDQICVNTGWLSRGGDFAACLPNEILLIFQSADNEGIDGIAR
jgi:hypothetical protein